jgi:hypothetical protein
MKGFTVIYRPHFVCEGEGWWWGLYSGNRELAISARYYKRLSSARRNFKRTVQALSQNFGSPPVKEVIKRGN